MLRERQLGIRWRDDETIEALARREAAREMEHAINVWNEQVAHRKRRTGEAL
jgi:hypothetical protein